MSQASSFSKNFVALLRAFRFPLSAERLPIDKALRLLLAVANTRPKSLSAKKGIDGHAVFGNEHRLELSLIDLCVNWGLNRF